MRDTHLDMPNIGKRKLRKIRVLYVIDSLGLGGAEKLLLSTLKAMPQVEPFVVYLHQDDRLLPLFSNYKTNYVPFEGNLFKVFYAVWLLKKMIRQNRIELVHAHLYWSTIIGRLSTPKVIPFISTYHSVMYNANEAAYSFILKMMDFMTYSSRHFTISVSDVVKRHLSEKLKIRHNSFVLHNFIEDVFFECSNKLEKHIRPLKGAKLKMVSVGNIKPAKNYDFYVDIIAQTDNLVWDIYGGDPGTKRSLARAIQKNDCKNIRLRGIENNIYEVLTQYDVFFMPSRWEGFGLALVEAMASRIPCIVSNIEVFKEVAGHNGAFFINLDNIKAFKEGVEFVEKGGIALKEMVEIAYEKSKEYRKKTHVEKLVRLYTLALNQ